MPQSVSFSSSNKPINHLVDGLVLPKSANAQSLVDEFNSLLKIQREWLRLHPPEQWKSSHVQAIEKWFNEMPVSFANAKVAFVSEWVDRILNGCQISKSLGKDWRTDESVWEPLWSLFKVPLFKGESEFIPFDDHPTKMSWIEHVVCKNGERHLDFATHVLKELGKAGHAAAMNEYSHKNPQYISNLSNERGRLAFFLYPISPDPRNGPAPMSHAQATMSMAWIDGIYEGVKQTKYADAKFAFLKQMGLMSNFYSDWLPRNMAVLEVGREQSPTAWVAHWLPGDPRAYPSEATEKDPLGLTIPEQTIFETTSRMIDILGQENHPEDEYGVQKSVAKAQWCGVQAAIDHASSWKRFVERQLLIRHVNVENVSPTRLAL